MWAWFVVTLTWDGMVLHSSAQPSAESCQRHRARIYVAASYCTLIPVPKLITKR